MKKAFALLSIALLAVTTLKAQETLPRHYSGISVGFNDRSVMQGKNDLFDDDEMHYFQTIDIDYGFRFSDAVEFGAYCSLQDGMKLDLSNPLVGISTIFVHYGIQGRLHLAALGHIQMPVDIYLVERLGGVNNGLHVITEHSFGVGASYYPFRNIGLFAEWKWGTFTNFFIPQTYANGSPMQLKVGLAFRL